jgi:uncharacterized protein YbjQ (UPF0145 family)
MYLEEPAVHPGYSSSSDRDSDKVTFQVTETEKEKGGLMIITTTHSIDGRKITEYVGVVSAESVHGINVVRDFFTGVRDFFGGRSQTLERALKEARAEVTDEIRDRARAMGADAIVGLDFEISMPSGRGGMLVVFATGTAVRLN